MNEARGKVTSSSWRANRGRASHATPNVPANKDWFQSHHFVAYWEGRDQSRRRSPEFIDFMETAILELR